MAVARLREPQRSGVEQFADTDPRTDIARHPLVHRLLRSRAFQFGLILPNQIIFWLVIAAGLFGGLAPGRNFATVITWYIWFCVVFLLMVGVGRGWCAMCPFGGFAEWIQRTSLWKRKVRSIGRKLRWPQSWSTKGLLFSVGIFVAMTWAEEFFNIAGPGIPRYTSYLVIFVISLALVTFLLFERRTFCRYLCPLTALIGSIGSVGAVAGFRTRDRDVCLRCPTKDCMRGSERGYGCPWYEWPGSARSNLLCGLCSECYKNCPYGNVGLYVQRPLTSVIQPSRRRVDVAWAIAVLLGLVVFQQVNALAPYATLDNTLNRLLRFPGYPNPLDYVGIIAAATGVVVGFAGMLHRLAAQKGTPLQAWFVPFLYGLAPLTASDYLARQLPKFWDHMLRIVPAISDPFDLGWNLFGTARSPLYHVRLLSVAGVVRSQLVVVALGTLGSLYAMWRIVRRDMQSTARRPTVLQLGALGFVLACGVALGTLYVLMGGAE